MPLLKHPTAGTIIDVTGARATALKARGYTEATDADLAPASEPPGAVQPQPPIDTRGDRAPKPPTDARPDDLLAEPTIDMRPPNPLGPTADSVAEADGAGLDDDQADNENDSPPAKSATKPEWVAYAEAHGVENADELTKDELIARVG